MAKLLVVLKVLPTDVNINLDELASKIKEVLPNDYELMKYEKIPIAFGLSALRLYILMPEEEEGGTEKLEESVRKVSGVSEVEVEMLHRMGF